jgi:hypothetical protein
LGIINDSLNKKIAKIDLLIEEKNKKILEKESQIKTLKKIKNEIPNHVSTLSANGVANTFSKYIERTTKSTSRY